MSWMHCQVVSPTEKLSSLLPALRCHYPSCQDSSCSVGLALAHIWPIKTLAPPSLHGKTAAESGTEGRRRVRHSESLQAARLRGSQLFIPRKISHSRPHVGYQRESESEKTIVKRMLSGLWCIILNLEKMQAAQSEFPIPETASIPDCNWAADSAT